METYQQCIPSNHICSSRIALTTFTAKDSSGSCYDQLINHRISALQLAYAYFFMSQGWVNSLAESQQCPFVALQLLFHHKGD